MKQILRLFILFILITIPSLVNAAISVTFTGSPLSGCVVLSTFTPTPVGCSGTPVYKWYFIGPAGDTTTAVSSGAIFHSFSVVGTHTVGVRMVCAPDTAWSWRSAYVTVTPTPVAGFTTSNPSVDTLWSCSPKTVNFINTSTADTTTGCATWSWLITGPGFSHSYTTRNIPPQVFTNAGTYTVTLLSINVTCGCGVQTSTRTAYIKVDTVADPCFHRADSVALCSAPATVIFRNCTDPSTASSYEWHFGDGSAPVTMYDTSSIAHTYSTPGVYRDTMISYSNLGHCPSYDTSSLVVGNFTAFISHWVDTICQGSTASFSDSSYGLTGGATGFNFYVVRASDGDTVAQSHGSNPASFTMVDSFGSGRFIIIDAPTNAAGCFASTTRSFYVRERPVIGAIFSDTTFRCTPPLHANFGSSVSGGTGPYRYHWTFSGVSGDTSNVVSPSHTYTSSGVFSPGLTITDAHGCTDQLTNSAYIRVSPPTVAVTASADSGCTPIRVTYNTTISPTGVDFIVDTVFFGDGGRCIGALCGDSAHIYSSGGAFRIKVKYHLPAYEGGCSDTVSVPVLIGATHPHFHIGASADSVCPHTVVRFNDSCTNCTSVSWHFQTSGSEAGDATTDTTSILYNYPGVYSYQFIGSVSGCTDTLLDTTFVFQPDTGTIVITTPDCAHRDTLQFQALGAGDSVYRYHWDFGDGTAVSTGAVRHHFSTFGTHTIVVIDSARQYGHRCQNTDTVHYNNFPRVVRDTAQFTTLCVGVRDSFLGTVNGDGTPYYFYTRHWGDGSSNTGVLLERTTYHVYTRTGTFYDTLITTDASGCLDTAARIAVTVTGPVRGFSAVDTFICAGDAVHFHDSATDAVTINYRIWNFNNTGAGSALPYMFPVRGSSRDTTITYPNPGNFTITLDDSDVNHCYSHNVQHVRAVKPRAFFTTPDSSIVVCQGINIPFHDTNTHCTYSWSFDMATWSTPSLTAQDTSYSFTANGTFHVRVRVASDGFGHRFPAGCTDTFGRNISVGPIAGTLTNVLPTTGACPPLPVYAYMVPIDYSYAWYVYHGSALVASTTGGTIPNNFALDYTLTGTGTYTAKVVYTSSLGCVDSASATYFIGGPTGFITLSADSGCAPLSVHATFTNTGTALSGTNYIWNTCPYGSITTTVPSLDLSYPDAGTFCPPTVVIQDGACIVNIDNLTDSIRIFPVPVVTVSSPGTLCYEHSTTLYAHGADSYSWSPTTFLTAPTDSITGMNVATITPVIVYTVTGTTIHGCSSSTILPVFVDSPIHLTVSGKDSICIGSCDTLIAHGIPGAAYSWVYVPGLSCAVCDSPVVCPTSTHTYTVTGANAIGCADTATFRVTVNPAPVITYSPDPAHVCLYGIGTQITASGASKYVWRPNLGLTCDSCANPVCTIPSNIVYTVTGTSIHGCRDSVYIPVVVYDTTQPKVREDTIICYGTQARLWAEGGEKYLWTPATGLNSNTIYNPIATPSVTTTYTVTITENVCFTRTMDVKVTVIPLPLLKLPPSVTIIAGNSVQLYVDTLNHVILTNYTWTPSDTTLSCFDCPSPIATPTANTTYSVTATTIEGCAGSGTVTIKLICESTQVFIPNTFTPNGDGVNDRFYVSGKGLGLIKRMAIYNRWGQLMYEGVDIRANDPGLGWDGSFRGEILPPDVYIYVLDILCETGEPFSFKGDISLVR